MNTRLSLLFVFLLTTFSTLYAAEKPRLTLGDNMIYGGHASRAKTVTDTIQLMGPTGSGAPFIGDFEAGWNGWTSVDATQPNISHWQVSDYNQSVLGNLAAWCGDLTIASCNDSLDMIGGYGNSWHQLLAYRVAVENPAIGADVSLTATLQYDSEPGYDFTHLSIKTEGNLDYTDIQSWDQEGVVNVDLDFSILPSELVGGTDVYVLWRFQSDGGWSDEDCSWPTSGACQVDDITTTVSQVGETDIVSFTDFQDGSFGDWFVDFVTGSGNFGHLWQGLRDIDPCATNYTKQVAFIDDGIVVPETGGSPCITWCYSGTGYVVNGGGGITAPLGNINVVVNSPIMPISNIDDVGMLYEFDVYVHQTFDSVEPPISHQWSIRSADTDGSHGEVQDIELQPWLDRNWFYGGGPEYTRAISFVSDLINPGADEIQVQIGVVEFWGWWFPAGLDASPAPYFDNISVKVFSQHGPAMAVDTTELAQDNFPEVDTLNYADLASMHVRFDMAANISPALHMRIDPGDSIIASIVPGRSGAELVQTEMHYAIQANPVFDSVRSFPTAGTVIGSPAVANGIPSPTRWQFDLPDSNCLYPGDVLHYYFRASDDLAGEVQVSTLPVDLTGFGTNFNDPLGYDTRFVMHALPTIIEESPGVYRSPKILFWNDQGIGGSEGAWYTALRTLGYQHGDDFDIFSTRSPESGIDNGLGGRTAGPALAPYADMLYSSGEMTSFTISNGDSWDAGDDVGALVAWLASGDKDLFIAGDNVASDVIDLGASGLTFVNSVMGLDVIDDDLKLLINGQTAPLVLVLPGNSVFSNASSWIAYGGCNSVNLFDGVVPRSGATRLAEFTNAEGLGGEYSYSAMTENIYGSNNRVISQPYDLRFTTIDPNAPVFGGLSGRTAVLAEVLTYFGLAGTGNPSAVVPETRFSTSNFPNPFNPSTEISYTISAPGHLTVKVFNTRGELVKVLLDKRVNSNGSIHWAGDNNSGGRVSSGIYFYEARMGNEAKIGKMALIK